MSEWQPDVERLTAFDDSEWLSVERHFAGRLYAYVSRRISDVQAREDVVQEAFLGAVRGIANFDPSFTFEQYLFGICRNRTIDHLRRRRAAVLGGPGDEDEDPSKVFDSLAREDETPSAIVREADLRGKGREVLRDVLREWVQETWSQAEFTRLMVIEALFSGSWRNRDTWERFGLRDETAVAGIKFRALKRMRELAARRDPSGNLMVALGEDAGTGNTGVDVAEVWKAARVSCPARHWLARQLSEGLDEGPVEFIRFHIDEMQCEWCQANRDDLSLREDDLEPLLEKVRASTAALLRSRTLET